MKISSLKTDTDLEVNGVWVDIGDGAEVLVARVENPRYEERLRALGKQHRHTAKRGVLPVEIQKDLLYQVASETVLLDWKGITDDAGKDIKYSQKKAYELLRDVRDFREIVFEIAETMQAYQVEEEEEDSKNSKAS